MLRGFVVTKNGVKMSVEIDPQKMRKGTDTQGKYLWTNDVDVVKVVDFEPEEKE